MSKKLEDKQRRREAEARKREALKKAHRKRNLVTTLIAVLVAGLVIGAIAWQKNDNKNTRENYGVSEAEANCGEIEDQDIMSADHVDVGTPHEPYTTNPPTSGPHYNSPSTGQGPVQTGFYDDAAEAPPEGVVHNLEHGMIVVYYNPEAPAEVIEAIDIAVEDESSATVATPWAEIEGDANLVLAAWGQSQSCEDVSRDVINAFRTKFQGIAGPEAHFTPVFRG